MHPPKASYRASFYSARSPTTLSGAQVGPRRFRRDGVNLFAEKLLGRRMRIIAVLCAVV
jgi:hypothetical protein